MDKERFNFELESFKGTSSKERLESIDLARKEVRLKISAALRQYHKKLVDSGRAPNYVLSSNDIIAALAETSFLENNPKNSSQVGDMCHTYYSTLSLNDVLAGISLPHRKRKEF